MQFTRVQITIERTFSFLSRCSLLQLSSMLLLFSDALLQAAQLLRLLLLLCSHLLMLYFQQLAQLLHFFILLLKKLTVQLKLFPCILKLLSCLLLCLRHLDQQYQLSAWQGTATSRERNSNSGQLPGAATVLICYRTERSSADSPKVTAVKKNL